VPLAGPQWGSPRLCGQRDRRRRPGERSPRKSFRTATNPPQGRAVAGSSAPPQGGASGSARPRPSLPWGGGSA
jgi:hypothetical protein